LGHFAKCCRLRQRSSSRPNAPYNDGRRSRDTDSATHSVDVDIDAEY
jgi:hypothetical protein